MSLLGITLALSTLVAAESSPIVTTNHGSFRGTVSEYVSGVNVFKGIRYSGAPTGSLRWTHSPEPPVLDNSIITNATEFSNECPQIVGGVVVGDEDCLFLNVWTPEGFNSSSNYPVFFWTPGGRFEMDSSSNDTAYDGSGLAKRGVVVVTVNYRLGPLGWLAHPQLAAENLVNQGYNASGNWGMMDQQAAIHWLAENIGNFGGSNTTVTVAGQSAGSALALDVAFSPQIPGLFQRIIAESGARSPHDPMTGSLATSHLTQAQAEDIGKRYLAALNVTTIDQARNLSLETLLTVGNEFASDTTFDGTSFDGNQAYANPPSWRPVVDGYYLQHNYEYALTKNNHSDVPILTGNNRDESGASPNPGVDLETYMANNTAIFEPLGLADRFFDLFPASTDAQANDQTNSQYRNQSLVSTWAWASAWAKGGAKSNVYTYYWTHAPPGQSGGAFHGSEVNYVFENLAWGTDTQGVKLNYTNEDWAIADKIASYWVNFMKTGDPNGDGLERWEPSSNVSKSTMHLGGGWGSMGIASDEVVQFFEDFFAQEPAY